MLALGYFSYIVLKELQSFISVNRNYEIVIIDRYSMENEKERKRLRYEDG